MAVGLTYSPGELDFGVKIARGPESVTQSYGLGNLGASGADIVGLETQRTIEQMQKTPTEVLAQMKQPKISAEAYSGIAYSPSTNKMFVGGVTFDREDVGSAVQAQSLIGQPPQPAPANVATDWEPISPQAYGQYIQNLKTPRTITENLALGTRSTVGGLVGGIGRTAEITGIPGIAGAGRALGEFAERTIEPSTAEQARSALIQQSSSVGRNLFDAVIQGIPSIGLSVALGGAGIGIAGRLAGGLAAVKTAQTAEAATTAMQALNKARTIGAYAGAATAVFPAELEGLYQSARDAKDAQGRSAYNLDDPSTRLEIATGAILSSLVQTVAEGGIAKAFSPALRGVMENASKGVAMRMAQGALKGGMNEAFAEGIAQIIQDTWFDPEVRSKLNATDIKTLAPYVAEKYGSDILLSFGAGGVLGGLFGGAANFRKNINTGNPVDLTQRAPTVGAQPGAQGELFPGAELGVGPAMGLRADTEMQPTGETLAAAQETDFAAMDERRRLEGLIADTNAQIEAAASGAASLDPVRISALGNQIARAREAIAAIDARGRLTTTNRSELMAQRLAEQPTLPFGQQNLLRGKAAPTEVAPTTPTPPDTTGLPLFEFPQGVLQTPVGEQIPLPLQGGAGVAPAPAALPVTPTQLELPLDMPQPGLPLEGGVARLRRTQPAIQKQLQAQQAASLAALAARSKAAKAELYPVETPTFTETPTLAQLKELRKDAKKVQSDRIRLRTGIAKVVLNDLANIAKAKGITRAEARRILSNHIKAGKDLLKQLDSYIADPTTVPVGVVPTPAPAPAAAPAPVAPTPAPAPAAVPTQPTEVPNATQVGQVQQSGVGQYQGDGGQVPGVGQTGNVPPQIQEGGGEAGGGNLPVEGGAQPQALGATNAGDTIGGVTFLGNTDPNLGNLLAELQKATGLSKNKIFFAVFDQKNKKSLVQQFKNIAPAKLGFKLSNLEDLQAYHTILKNLSLSDDDSGFNYPIYHKGNVINLIALEQQKFIGRTNIEVLSHELGHSVEYELLSLTTEQEFDAILKDYVKYLQKMLPGLTKEQVAKIVTIVKQLLDAKNKSDLGLVGKYKTQLRRYITSVLPTAKPVSKQVAFSTLRPRGQQLKEGVLTMSTEEGSSANLFASGPGYTFGFSEYFADNVAKWATTQAKPLTIVEKFFSRLAQRLRRVYEGGRKLGLPDQSIADFLNRMGPPDFTTMDGASTPVSPTPPPGGGVSLKELSEIAPQVDNETVVPITREENAAANDRIESFVSALPPGMQSSAARIAYNLRDYALKGAYLMTFGRDLENWVAKLFPNDGSSVRQYFAGIRKRVAIVEQLRHEVDTIMLLTKGMSQETRKAVNDFLSKSTLNQVWGYQPSWIAEPVAINAEAQAQYNALPDNAKVLVDKIFQKNEADFRKMRAAIQEQIQAGLTGPEYDSLPQEEKNRLQKEAATRLFLMDSYLKKRSGPYAALSRFGNFITVARSQRLKDLESIPVLDRDAEQKKQIEELQANPDDYIVAFSDSLGDAKVLQRDLEAQFPNMKVDSFEKQRFYGREQVPVWMAMQQIRERIASDKESGLGKKELAAIDSFIMDLYVGALAENSARRHQLVRKGTAGYDDMLRAFAVGGTANAHFIGSMNFEPEIAGALRQMGRDVKSEEGPADRARRSTAYNEILARHVNAISTVPTPIQDALLGYNSLWTLALLPRYHIMNATQTYMFGLPVMAASRDSQNREYGYSKTLAAINGTYKDMAYSFSKATNGDLGEMFRKFFAGEFDLDKLKRPDGKAYSPDEIRLLETLRDNGLLDVGLGYDLKYWEANQTGDGTGALRNIIQKITAITRQVEIVNRVSTGMAAYRLARQGGKSEQQATEFATSMVSNAQGDMSGINAPRVFSALPFGKIIGQFRKYQLNVAALLIKNAHAAFAGASEDERKLGRAVLRNVLGQTALVTGALGLPMAGTLAYILAAIFGPPDEPVNEERFLRRILGNDRLADFILNGVPAGLGVDVSAQLGLNNTFSVAPYTDLDFAGRDAFAKTVVGLGGPLFGTAANFADGFKYLTEGQLDKGIEAFLPNGLKQAMRAYRETFNKGVTRRNGDLVMSPEEFTYFDSVLQTLGFTTSQMKDIKRRRQDVYEFDKYFEQRTTQIRRQYAEAKRGGDTGTMADIRRDWQALQQSKKRVGLTPSDMSTLLSAPKQQLKREQQYRERIQRLEAMEGAED